MGVGKNLFTLVKHKLWAKSSKLYVKSVPQRKSLNLEIVWTQFKTEYQQCSITRGHIHIGRPCLTWLSKNPTICNMIRWFTGANDSSTKCLMFQALFLFSWFVAKMVSMYFLFIWSGLEHQMLDRRVICPSNPANQCIILSIVGFELW